jgi:peptidoglycan/LPS O-acetylase OafA/YrhL
LKDRIQIIDGLRGIAILGVVWHHLSGPFAYPGFVHLGSLQHPLLPLTFLSNGWLGVNLFFVLSGFVLYWPYVSGKRPLVTKQDWLTYYRNRAFRLLPLYYVSLAYGFLFIARPHSAEQWLRDGALMLTATYGFTKSLWLPPYNWVLWSLGIEIWFSVLFPFLIVLARKISVPKMLAVVAVIAMAVRFLGLAEIFKLPISFHMNPMKDSVIGRLDDFVLGMFIAWLWLKSSRGTMTVWSKPWVPVAGIALVFAASHLWDDAVLQLVPYAAVPLFTPVLLLGIFIVVMHLLAGKGFLVRLLTLPAFTVPGVMCYSIYIWHGVLRLQVLGASRSPVRVLLYLAVVAAVSYLSFRIIEMNRWFRPVRAAAPPVKATKQRARKARAERPRRSPEPLTDPHLRF